MNKMTICLIVICTFLLVGCGLFGSADQTPTQPASPVNDIAATETLIPVPAAITPVFTSTATPIPQVAPTVCSDPAVAILIDSFKQSMLTTDGPLLGSLVSPAGMEVRYFRNGTVVTYLPSQAIFLFETTFEANWGNEPGSGLEKKGSFHDVIVPELVKIFNQPYSLHCNEIRHGGATYDVSWPYQKDFYSIYYTGTEQNGYLDWHTWVLGVEYHDNKPLIYALMNYFWEP